jgi:hypothetical protein
VSIISNSTSPKILVITFVGSHYLRFYKDCRTSETRLRASLEKFNTELITFTLSDLIKAVPFFSSSRFFFLTRYGVGAWFWKPILIKHAMNLYNPDYLIYVDSDCGFNKRPSDFLQLALKDSEIAFFAQKNLLKGWISKRAIRILGLTDRQLSESKLVTAGVVMIKNTIKAREMLTIWELTMKNPRLLLHPIFNVNGYRHLHDQSILSALIARNDISCNLSHTGFYSLGIESISESLANSWIFTGDISASPTSISISKRLWSISDYYSRRLYDISISFFVSPVHWLYFCLERALISLARKRNLKRAPSS